MTEHTMRAGASGTCAAVAPRRTGRLGGCHVLLRPRPCRCGDEGIASRIDAFNEWFDSLTLADLDDLLADEGVNGVRGAAEIIAENIRHPGGKHEWLMVAEARQIKKWGVSMKTIQEGRSFTDATMGRSFRHGGTGAGRMHREVRAMIRSSNSYGGIPREAEPMGRS